MGNFAICVEKLGKRYQIGHAAKRPDNLRELLRSLVRAPFHYLRTRLREPSADELIWALKEISFDVKHGEVLGIIGRNGAGKSTLLKILSRITEPSAGRAIVYGRVGSLLEVGTGFHPELTGRENIFLNGTILGMRKAEIQKKFDEIVEFSGVEKFLDTPVKRYSSGMYVRLAFAVAAHLEPEILLIDEVLAVGDIEFQKKCLGRMRTVATEGRTVLFVSHTMPTIESLCEKVLWIEGGRIMRYGPTPAIISQYIDFINQASRQREIGQYTYLGHRRGTGEIQFTELRIMTAERTLTSTFRMGETIRIEVDFHVYQSVEYAIFCIMLFDALTQIPVTNWTGCQQPRHFSTDDAGTFTVLFPENSLRARKYYLYLGILRNTDMPYDVWDGGGTEFIIHYPANVESLPICIGRDHALVSLPIVTQIHVANNRSEGE